ncbi:Molybdenum transport system permease protein ModB [Vibrio cholerae]|nr:Molybdenum transport system permease protein ModB [Vibrio cholerae]
MVIALPLMVRSIRLSLESVDQKLEQAARTLGASPMRVFFTITLPLTLPGILTGVMLAFARSLGEFGATISFVSNIPGETQTIPLAMFTFLETRVQKWKRHACVRSRLPSRSARYLSRNG